MADAEHSAGARSQRARSTSALRREELESQLNALQLDLKTQSATLQQQLSHLTSTRPLPLPLATNTSDGERASSDAPMPSPDRPAVVAAASLASEEAEKRRDKEQQFEHELQELQMKLLYKANERMEIEAVRQRFEAQLDEERETSAFLRRKVKQLELEAIEVRKRLNSEMQLQNKHDLELQDMHKRLPALLMQLEERDNQNQQLREENQQLRHQLDALRAELDAYRQQAQSTASQEQRTRTELEATNQRLVDELLSLNCRLSETTQQLLEQRAKRERDLELSRSEATAKAALDLTVAKLERDNNELRAMAASREHEPAQAQAAAQETQRVRQENDALRYELAMVKQQKAEIERSVAQSADGTRNEWQELTTKQSEEIARLTDALQHERTQRQQLEQLNSAFEGELATVKERLHKLSSDSLHSPSSANSTPQKPSGVYASVKGDEVDHMLGSLINQLADGLELLPPNFTRLKRGTYRFGTKQITIQIQNGQPVVRVGGGFMPFTQFVKKHGKMECMKLSKEDD